MNVTRAIEIIQSAESIRVTHGGKPVWIEGVDEESAMAQIHPEENPTDRKTVAIVELVEQ